jgi:hypothetical protein
MSEPLSKKEYGDFLEGLSAEILPECKNEESEACLKCSFSELCQGYPSELASKSDTSVLEGKS